MRLAGHVWVVTHRCVQYFFDASMSEAALHFLTVVIVASNLGFLLLALQLLVKDAVQQRRAARAEEARKAGAVGASRRGIARISRLKCFARGAATAGAGSASRHSRHKRAPATASQGDDGAWASHGSPTVANPLYHAKHGSPSLGLPRTPNATRGVRERFTPVNGSSGSDSSPTVQGGSGGDVPWQSNPMRQRASPSAPLPAAATGSARALRFTGRRKQRSRHGGVRSHQPRQRGSADFDLGEATWMVVDHVGDGIDGQDTIHEAAEIDAADVEALHSSEGWKTNPLGAQLSP